MPRIIPWSLPSVAGGSVGGYTPAPTPEPVTNYPYDLDNMVVSSSLIPKANLHQGGTPIACYGNLHISGVSILDTSYVSTVIATVRLSPGDLIYNYTRQTPQADLQVTVTVSEEKYLDVDISGIMTLAGGTVAVYDGNADMTGQLSVDDIILGTNVNVTGSMLSYSLDDTSTADLQITKIIVYNANGIALQEWDAE